MQRVTDTVQASDQIQIYRPVVMQQSRALDQQHQQLLLQLQQLLQYSL